MDFSHYTDEPVELAVALVNTDQRPAGKEDELTSLDALARFLKPYAHLWRGEVREPDVGDLARIHVLRERLRAVFCAADEAEAADILNKILSDSVATPRVSVHHGAPHLHFEPLGTTLSQWLAVVTGMGLATVLVDHGLDRFGTCDAGDCLDVYVDTSRNRSRRHCSSTCSTRENVAAYRRRKRSEADTAVT